MSKMSIFLNEYLSIRPKFLGSRLNNNDPEGSSVHMYEPFCKLEMNILELKSIIIVFFFSIAMH